MDLTLNELRALKSLLLTAEKAKGHEVCVAIVKEADERWEILSRYLKEAGLGSIFIGNSLKFNKEKELTSLLRRICDLIEDAERRRRDVSRMYQAAWFSALAAAVSALAALLALFR